MLSKQNNTNIPFLPGLPSTLPATFSAAPVTLSFAFAAGLFFVFVAVLLVGVFLVTRPEATFARGLDVLALVEVFFLVIVRFLPSGSVEMALRMRGTVMPSVYH